MKKYLASLLQILIVVMAFSAGVFSQGTEFRYQGALFDGVTPANASYDFEFSTFFG